MLTLWKPNNDSIFNLMDRYFDIWDEPLVRKDFRFFSDPKRRAYLEDENYILEYAYPGHKKEDILLSCEGDTLTVEIKSEKESKGFSSETMKESLLLRDYDLPNLKAAYKEGILKLIIPKKEEKKPKKLEIEF
jgi:HSP20 family protein